MRAIVFYKHYEKNSYGYRKHLSSMHLTLYHGQVVNFVLGHEYDAAATEDLIAALQRACLYFQLKYSVL